MKDFSGTKLLVIALVCGLLAAALTVFYLHQVENKYRLANQPKQEKRIPVVVTKRNMNKGEVITVKDIQKLQVPAQLLPSHAILAKDYKKIINRTLQKPVGKGRPMVWGFVTGSAAETFSENLELGSRAKSIKVNKVDSFDGLLRPGDHIDLLGNFDLKDFGVSSASQSNSSSEVVMPVLENVIVLSAGREDFTGRRYERKKNKGSTDGFDMEFTIITVKLTPQQVARIELAEQTGDIFAVLRHPKDTSLSGFQYKEVSYLLEEDKPENMDLVLDANGKPIGRIVGDNVVDADGNIIGKVVNGKAVTFDGKPLGKIVENVDPNDPINQIAERADVVRDADGNVIGKVEQFVRDADGNVIGRIVDGKVVNKDGKVIGRVDANGRAVGVNGESLGVIEKAIVDKNGEIIGKVDKDGTAIALDGQVIGKVEKGVALDANGNVIDMSNSAAAPNKTTLQEVVRDANGNVIGKVVNGKVIDADGNVVGRIDANGNAVSMTGEKLGSVDEVMMDASGNVVGEIAEVVRDANGNVVGKVEQVVRDADGNIIGRVVNGEIVDADGNVVGRVDASGNAVGLNGESLGKVEKVVLDASGKVVGTVGADGKAIALDGTSLGSVEKALVDADGNVVGDLEQVVRDANGNIIGVIKNGKVVDANGKVIGEVKDGKVIGLDGKVLADNVSVSTEEPLSIAAELKQQREKSVVRQVNYIDYISGGTAKDGIVPMMRVRLE